MEVQDTGTAVPQNDSVDKLKEALKVELHKQQDIVYAIVGGLLASCVGAVLWAIITVATERQIGIVAIGLGLLVGFAVRFFGAGIDKYFGVIGAILALFGCALGNLLSQLVFAAHSQSVEYFDVIAFLNFGVIIDIFQESFTPMDVVFYGIAAYEGYRFAFRNLDQELVQAVAAGQVQPPPFAKYRLPLVAASFLVLVAVGYGASRGSVAVRTLKYESGERRAEGELAGGLENGYWQTWWENGKIQSQGFYIEGKQDSTWSYFNEDGEMIVNGSFRDAMQEGPWEYYTAGKISSRGSYHHGRKTGVWTTFDDGGKISIKATFLLDKTDGPSESYFDNGQLSGKGSFRDGLFVGLWEYWNREGVKISESSFDEPGNEKVLNTWSYKGVPEIINGNGTIKIYDLTGTIVETGPLKNGLRTGTWKKFYSDGTKQEEGEYKDNVYYLTNAWTPEGKAQIVLGSGTYEGYYPDGAVSVIGKFKNGLRTGEWVDYFNEDRKVMDETTYVSGKATGPYVAYFQDGTPSLKGLFLNGERDGEWIWYQENASIESKVSFIQGKKDGKQFFYNEAGEVLKTEVYQNGKFIESIVGEAK